MASSVPSPALELELEVSDELMELLILELCELLWLSLSLLSALLLDVLEEVAEFATLELWLALLLVLLDRALL